MKTSPYTWNCLLPDILTLVGDDTVRPKRQVRIGTDAYLVASPEKRELIFAIPVLVNSDIFGETGLPVSSSTGAVHTVIERIKRESAGNQDLSPLRGALNAEQTRYTSFFEPCTIASSPSCIASHLWRPDDLNRVVPGGIELLLRGCIPHLPPHSAHIPFIAAVMNRYCDAVCDVICSIPEPVLEKAMRGVWDQQDLRARLPDLDLVCFIGDGTRPAREMTRERCWYRVAGPKCGVHIPFHCPIELSPAEVELAGTGETITGLGIRKKEIFAITGANAEGKTSLLEAILSGEDDHAYGDGRERLVTTPGISRVDATNLDIRGGDVSRFFSSLPPGMGGTPRAVTGRGSGSLSMAFRIQEAIRKERSIIVIDEDCAAMNLLIPCYCGTEAVHPLSTLISGDREWLGDTSIVVAGSAMEMLIAGCDRILKLTAHQAEGVSRDRYRKELSEFYCLMSRDLEDKKRWF